MREKPITEQVDVVIGEDGQERLITCRRRPRIAGRTSTGPPRRRAVGSSAAARRAKDDRDADPAFITSAADLPVAADTAAAPASAATTAGRPA